MNINFYLRSQPTTFLITYLYYIMTVTSINYLTNIKRTKHVLYNNINEIIVVSYNVAKICHERQYRIIKQMRVKSYI